MSRHPDPCYCEQACEYEALLEYAATQLYILSRAARDKESPKKANELRQEISKAIAKYKRALDEDSDEPEGLENEYQPKNERDE